MPKNNYPHAKKKIKADPKKTKFIDHTTRQRTGGQSHKGQKKIYQQTISRQKSKDLSFDHEYPTQNAQFITRALALVGGQCYKACDFSGRNFIGKPCELLYI